MNDISEKAFTHHFGVTEFALEHYNRFAIKFLGV